jgi:uncharacterized RDD family membrane protein YckC
MNASLTQRVYPAGFISRSAAFFLDLIIIAIVTVAAVVALRLLADFLNATLFTALVTGTRLENLYLLIVQVISFALSYLLILFYFAMCWSLVGFTPGMYLSGLRIVRKNGELPGFFRALARVFLFTLSALPLFLGFFWVIIDRRRQAWHDKIVGTYVVYLDFPDDEPVEPGRRLLPAHS